MLDNNFGKHQTAYFFEKQCTYVVFELFVNLF